MSKGPYIIVQELVGGEHRWDWASSDSYPEAVEEARRIESHPTRAYARVVDSRSPLEHAFAGTDTEKNRSK